MDEGKSLFLHKEGITNQQNMHVTSLLEPELVSCDVYETHCVHFNQFDSDKSSFEKVTASSVVTVVTEFSSTAEIDPVRFRSFYGLSLIENISW